jgi:hypothetical protein
MATGSRPQDDPYASRRARRAFPLAPIAFRYEGRTQATVTGPVSGRLYRFDEPGAVRTADERDVPWLACLPDLRRV